MQSTNDDGVLRTRLYVDGYNLYYGCLKKTSDKWLDPLALVEHILPSVLYERNGVLTRSKFRAPAVKYFTAPILSSFARSDDSVVCQSQYHAALRGHLGKDVEIITGYYEARPTRAHVWLQSKAAGESPVVEIWKLEEKQSDVALALHAFCDAVLGNIDQAIVMTNDSDVVPAMQMIRQYTNVILGLIAPVRKGDGRRRVNRELNKHAHWTRTHILDEEFAASHLPPMVRLKGGAVHKPLSWYPYPELLMPVYEEAKRVRGSNGAARRWLNEPCKQLGGRVPIEMCSSQESALELLEYMRRYAVSMLTTRDARRRLRS
jgi:6-hydroxy-3-succinoylpyridine 3-monooxygenase